MLWAVLSYCPATGRNGNEQRVTGTAREIGTGKDRDRLRELLTSRSSAAGTVSQAGSSIRLRRCD